MLYSKVVNNIPWAAVPIPTHKKGQWIAAKEINGSIQTVYHLHNVAPMEARIYTKHGSEQLHLTNQRQPVPEQQLREVRVLRCGGDKRAVLDYNPLDETNSE